LEDVGWVNGRPAETTASGIGLDDPAYHAGLGVFETLAVRGGEILDLNRHISRLASGAKATGVELPDEPLLRRAIAGTASQITANHAWLKIVVTRGGHWSVSHGAVDPDRLGQPVSAVVLPWRRNPNDPLVGYKTLNYAANILGLEWARARGADDGVWLNTRGHLAEGCTSNLFLVCGRKLFTPGPREGILPGIVRSLVLNAAADVGLTVHEGRVRPRRLATASEVFLTSSVMGLRPLARLNGRPLGGGQAGREMRRLADAIERRRSVDT
jgi:branched-subunit amino acid aminotransferase/4-amino-4-deoxychorismate lyase